MGFVRDMAFKAGQVAGESKRKKESIERVNQQDANTKAYVENIHATAQNGDVEAMYSLGCYYNEGSYVVVDMDKACFWWTHAAERGHVNAQYNLGCLYIGEVSASFYDANLAGHWFNAAACNGDPDAMERLQGFKYSNFSQKWKLR